MERERWRKRERERNNKKTFILLLRHVSKFRPQNMAAVVCIVTRDGWVVTVEACDETVSKRLSHASVGILFYRIK